MKTLLIGAGRKRERIVATERDGKPAFFREMIAGDLVTLDINPDHNPNVLHDLNDRPLPFPDNEFDEIHAYEVLEHIGRQGDYKAFCDEFSEYWRILKPGGLLVGTCPSHKSEWAWGDPSHVRILTLGTFVFLSQAEYAKQVGVTPMSDFRYLYKADFDVLHEQSGTLPGDTIFFTLKSVKPSRISTSRPES